MSDFLMIGGWSGRQRVPVKIIGETQEGFRIEVQERVLLPGRGFLNKGQSALVSKSVIRLSKVREPEQAPPQTLRQKLYLYAAGFLHKLREKLSALVLHR